MTIEDIVHQWHMSQPHPLAPSVTVGDYTQALKMAAVLKFGGDHPGPQEAANLWHEYQQTNQTLAAQGKAPIAPEEFTQMAQQMAKVSFAYHGRPPSMYEIAKLRDAKPSEISDYFGSLPDEHYPTVSAADMAKAMHSARPWAIQATGQEPTKLDAAYLHHSGQNPADYYEQRAKKHDGSDDQSGPQPGVAGPGNDGGQPPAARAADSGVASGSATASGAASVSQG